MDRSTPQQIYRERIIEFSKRESELLRKYNHLGYVRLIVFLLMIAVFILLVQKIGWFAGVFLLLAIGGFGKLVYYHEGIKEQADFAEKLRKINELEQKSLRFEYHWNPTGSRFFDPQHPYLSDLDIFGSHSLFQYVNRATTSLGQERLAEWFSRGACAEEITARQKAVEDLLGNIDLRQNLMAEGISIDDIPEHLQALNGWLKSENYLLPKVGIWFAKWVLPFFTVGSCLSIAYFISFSYSWIPLIIPGYLMYRTNRKITEINSETEKVAGTLNTYSRILSRIEGAHFESLLLKSSQSSLLSKEGRPSKLIAQLGYRIEQLNVRQNFFGIFFNLFVMWDFHWVVALEKSKILLSRRIEGWLTIISSIESLSSLANLYFNNPDYGMPNLNGTSVQAVGMGHPLIPTEDRITNPIDLKTSGHVLLITGSNMAGKSTYLRSVGVNLVLANAGGPVCAKEFTFAPRPIYASMRVADALEDGASSFYAELAKLKIVIDAVKSNPKIIFLLDEILKGTNSGDRNKGSEALLRQLIGYGGTGLVATHDLALTKMEKEFPMHLENWYFDVLIEEDKLAFDYKIKRGICQSFNATLLMKQMGIEI